MFLGINTQSKHNIPSFQTIDFKLSENYITSRNPSISSQNDYQPGSLTYTQTQINSRNSLKFIQLPDQNKQNFNSIQIALNNQNIFEAFRNPQSTPKKIQPKQSIKMRRKKSILVIKNLQLNYQSTTDKSQQDTKRSSDKINFNRIQKRSSFTNRSRATSASTKQSQAQSLTKNQNYPPSNISQSIIMINNSHYSHSTDPASQIKKKSISSMKTQDRSVISSVVTSSSKTKIQRSVSQRTSVTRSDNKKNKTKNISDRYNKNINVIQISINQRNSLNVQKREREKIRNRQVKRRFLQDAVPLQGIINVKSIKLQENTDISRAYLRKIIQNRVSIQHYVQNNKNSREIRQ